jgi:hypothetical protein
MPMPDRRSPFSRPIFSRFAALAFAALALAACNLNNGPGVDFNTTPTTLSAAEIRTILSGKSWHFVGPNNTGTTLYAADGTSLVEVDGKGTTKGHWETRDGQLCESFESAPFLPGGVPMSCYPFTPGANGTYQAGKATFTLAS